MISAYDLGMIRRHLAFLLNWIFSYIFYTLDEGSERYQRTLGNRI